jgi:hypothetical protein
MIIWNEGGFKGICRVSGDPEIRRSGIFIIINNVPDNRIGSPNLLVPDNRIPG